MTLMERCAAESIPPTQKAVLLALAADADGKRQCAPVLQTIAARAGVTRRTVQYTMRKLERARLVRVDGYGRDGCANTYTIFPKGEKSD